MLAASLFAMPVLLLNGAPTSAASQSATTTVNVTIDPVISITASPNIEMDITPTTSGQFRTANGNVVISTNNVKGYTTYITSNTTETSLKQPAAAGVSAVIPTTSATPTVDNKTLTIGASATTSMPSGTYSNTLLLTAVTNN